MTTTLKRKVTQSILSVVLPYKTIFRPCLQLYQSILSTAGDWLWKAANINDKNVMGSSLTLHNPFLFFCSRIVTEWSNVTFLFIMIRSKWPKRLEWYWTFRTPSSPQKHVTMASDGRQNHSTTHALQNYDQSGAGIRKTSSVYITVLFIIRQTHSSVYLVS